MKYLEDFNLNLKPSSQGLLVKDKSSNAMSPFKPPDFPSNIKLYEFSTVKFKSTRPKFQLNILILNYKANH